MPANIGPTIRVDGEKEYRQQMSQIVQQTKTLAAEMKNLTSGFDLNTSALKRSQDSVKNLSSQVDLQKQAISQMTDMLKKSTSAYGENDSRTQRYKENIAKAENELGRMEDSLKKATSEMRIEQSIAEASSSSHLSLKNAVAQVKNEMQSNKVIAAQLKTEYSDSKIRVAALEKEMLLTAKTEGTQSDQTKELASRLKEAKSEMDRLNSEFRTAQKEAGGMGSIIQSLGDKVKHVASNALPAMGNAIKSGFKGAVNIGASAAKTFVKSVAAVGTAAAAGIVALGKVGLEYNSQMESYTTNFETMLGSSEAAAKKVDELKTMAAKTPFDMDTLAGATQQLLAMGVASEDTGKYLKQLGDISLGDKQKLESLTNAFGKMNSTGKVTLENINMMAEQGFNPLNVISQQTGESMSDLYKRVSDGAVSLDEIKGAMEIATSAGGQFAGGMERASKTTEGMISTLKDNAKALVGEVFQPISDGLKDQLLPGAIGAIDELTSAFRTNGIDGMISAASDMIANALAQFADSLPNFIDMALQIVSSLGEGIKNNQGKIADGVVKTITTLVSGLLASLPDLLKTGASLVIEIARGLAKAFPEIAAQAAAIVVELVSSLWSHRRDILDAGIEIVQGIIDGIASAWETLTSWFSDLWNSLFGHRTVNIDVNATASGGGRSPNGSHANGLGYVPFDNYLANLHKGEMVLTRRQADDLRSTGYMTLPARSVAPGAGQPAQTGGKVYDFSGMTFNIYQRDGEDGETLSHRVMELIQTEVERRASAIVG